MIVTGNSSKDYREITVGSLIIKVNGLAPYLGLCKNTSKYDIDFIQKRTHKISKIRISMPRFVDNSSSNYLVRGKNDRQKLLFHITDFTMLPSELNSVFGEQGVVDIYFDLRDNFGGKIKNLIDFASRFIPKGETLFYLQKKGEIFKVESNNTKNLNVNINKIYLFFNENTYSCAELFSDILRKNFKCLTIGNFSGGKRSMISTEKYQNLTITIPEYLFSVTSNHFFPNTVLTPDIFCCDIVINNYLSSHFQIPENNKQTA
jgi:hypothetical protein